MFEQKLANYVTTKNWQLYNYISVVSILLHTRVWVCCSRVQATSYLVSWELPILNSDPIIWPE